MSGGIIDGGYAANDLTIGQCRGETYVFWASADFQNSRNVNSHTSLGSRLRYYKPSNGDVNTFANSANVYGLSQSNINSVMWRGIQCAPALRRAAPRRAALLLLRRRAAPTLLLAASPNTRFFPPAGGCRARTRPTRAPASRPTRRTFAPRRRAQTPHRRLWAPPLPRSLRPALSRSCSDRSPR